MMIARLVRHLFAFACFVLGVAATGAAIALVHPWHGIPGAISRKLHAFSHGGEKYDTLFLGSSRVYRHCDPRTFAATAAARGVRVRAFNAGIDGMYAPEDSFVCERLLAEVPSLRRVFLEVSYFAGPRLADTAPSLRVIAWHDWHRTLAACRACWSDDPAKRRPKKKEKRSWAKNWAAIPAVWPEWSAHLRLFLRRATNLGRGATLARSVLMPPGNKTEEDVLGMLGNGFVPVSGPPGPGLAEFQQALAARTTTPARHLPLPPEAEDNLHRMIRQFQSHGVEVFLIVAPQPLPFVYVPTDPLGARILDFNEIDKFPELFKLEHRHDYGHLNAAGAQIFSRRLAEEWLSAAGR